MKNTHGPTHLIKIDEVEEIFEINRKGEDERFVKLPNRKLLWHGSKFTNFAGILSQGLRIAPKEAPVNGYMFGRGVYFADMVTKSAQYSTFTNDNTALILLCEVSLGNMYEKRSSEFIEKLPKEYQSTKGLGAIVPDTKEKIVTEDGVEIPLGKGISSNIETALHYNEYIIYDEAQVKMKYLLKVKLKQKY